MARLEDKFFNNFSKSSIDDKYTDNIFMLRENINELRRFKKHLKVTRFLNSLMNSTIKNIIPIFEVLVDAKNHDFINLMYKKL